MTNDKRFQPAAFNLTKDQVLNCYGEWTLSGLTGLTEKIQVLPSLQNTVYEDGSDIQTIDSAGAVFLYKWFLEIEHRGGQVERRGFKEEHEALIQLVSTHGSSLKAEPP